jgi:hypothetical protein
MGMRDEIKEFAKTAVSPVLAVPSPELPQWNGQIYVRRVSPRELSTFWQGADDDDAADERAAFAVLVACDAQGSRVFEPGDVDWLATCGLLMPLVERIYWAARAHNGLTEENRRVWEKNLPNTVDAGSRSS